MADDVDRAQEAEELFRAEMMHRRQQQRSALPVDAGSAECEACGVAIDPRRRAAVPSATRCTECAARHEKWGM